MDKIILCDLAVPARIGVPAEERAQPQRLLVSVELERDLAAAGRADDLTQTADYAAVAALVRDVAAARPRQLVEALAEDVAAAVLARCMAAAVTVEVKKFSIPDTQHVAVRIRRTRQEPP